jgi:hypothetical protein
MGFLGENALYRNISSIKILEISKSAASEEMFILVQATNECPRKHCMLNT